MSIDDIGISIIAEASESDLFEQSVQMRWLDRLKKSTKAMLHPSV